MRPVLKPGLRRLWRDQETVQFGEDPEHAVIVSGLDTAAARFVDSLDGSREVPDVLGRAGDYGLSPTAAARLLSELTGLGVLGDASSHVAPLRALDPFERDRLQPDLAALSLLERSADGGPAALDRRRQAVVAVDGAGRVGSAVACLLAAAGVGHVVVRDTAVARAADTAPAGLGPDDVGTRRDRSLRAVLRRVAPGVRCSAPPRRPTPDLVVLAPASAVDPQASDRLLRLGVPHLYAGVRETRGLVGPFVLPGRSSCLRCHDLHRADRDPAWPHLLAQLVSSGPAAPLPCDVVLATVVAAQAALQVLTFLRGETPDTVDTTIETLLPQGRVHRRSWRVHSGCGCKQLPDGSAAGRLA